MPLAHERTFRVRLYECDSYGHVNNVNYLRYMQEAASDASAAAGYDAVYYAALGTGWLARWTDIEFLQPLVYGDSVTIRTWVADIRPVRSQRAYELRRAADDGLVARATTEWVHVNLASGQPVPIPAAMTATFFPDGPPPAAAAGRDRSPAPPPPPPGVYKMRRTAMWQDMDSLGHVNNANYVGYASDCGFRVAAAFGWPAQRMQAMGFGIVVRRLHIEHLRPAVLDDELEIATWAYGLRRVTAHRAYTISRVADNALLARVAGLYAWVDLNTGQPMRIPPEFLASFAPNFVSEAAAQA